MRAARAREEALRREKEELKADLAWRRQRYAAERVEGWDEGFRERGRRFGMPFAEARLLRVERG